MTYFAEMSNQQTLIFYLSLFIHHASKLKHISDNRIDAFLGVENKLVYLFITALFSLFQICFTCEYFSDILN